MNNINGKKVFFCMTGVLLIGLGVAVCRIGQMGIDPFMAMCTGISDQLGTKLGNVSFITQLLLFVIVLLFNRSYIGIGTIINGVFVGYISDGFYQMVTHFIPVGIGEETAFCLMSMAIGILILTFGVSIYFTGDAGLSPYDAVGKILRERTNLSYSVCRVLTDGSCLAIAFFFHGPIGIGTVIIACFMGPLIQFWNKNVSEPMYQKEKVLLGAKVH